MRLSLKAKLAVGCLLAVLGRLDAQEPAAATPTGEEAAPATVTPVPAHQYGTVIPNGIPYQNFEPCETCAETACESCDEGCLWNDGSALSLSDTLFGEECRYKFGGWGQVGYHTQSNGVFNNQPGRVNLHQAWIWGERVADGSDGLDWGYRIDAIYGIDGANTQAFGNPPGTWDYLNGFGNDPREAWALPQVYGEVAYQDFSVKLGHFYTLIGYEVVPATGNFFYSHAFTFNFSEPFTHTGALSTLNLMDGDLTLYNGWVAGADTGFEQVNGGSAYLGGFRYAFSDDVAFSYIANVGDQGSIGNGFFGTALLDVTRGSWQWVLQNDVTKHDAGAVGPGDFDSVALVNYLFYEINDCWKVGTRTEWYNVEGVDFWEVTAGLNFLPHANLRIRPEFRYQFSDEAESSGVNPLNIPVDRGIFGIDMILTF